MAQFVSVSTFRKRLAELLKVKRGVYSGVSAEICMAFKGASIEQIRQNRDMILMNNDAVVIKLRIQDKKQVPLVVLLDVYPKRGPSQQLDIEDNETNRLVREFAAELNTGQLAIHDINDDLKVL